MISTDDQWIPRLVSWQTTGIRDPCHHNCMIKNNVSNPYAQQVLAQGRDLSNAPARKREFPCTIGLRTFQTEEEYNEALADFLNGY